MKLKRILGLSLASIFIISQSVSAISTVNFTNKDNFIDTFNYIQYPIAVKPNDPIIIPDSQLKAAINKTLDASRKEDQDVTKDEMESLTNLNNNLNSQLYNVSDLSGLEYAVNLTELYIQGDNQNKSELKNVNIVSHLTKLTDLYLNNNISNIDLSKNINLINLDLSNNNLTTIDLSKNINLGWLDLSNNNLTTIDLSKNVNLGWLDFSNNNLSTIDLSKNVNLGGLDLSNNNLSTIDLSKNVNLVGLGLSNNNLSTIDSSKNVNLGGLDLSNNNLSTIDLSKNVNLGGLDLSNNNLSTIDLNKNVNLIELYLNNNRLSTIDLSNNTQLTKFEAKAQKVLIDLVSDDVTVQNDKVIIKNKIAFNGVIIGSITGTGVTFDANTNTVTIDNPSKDKFVSYNFDNNSGFSGIVTANLSATGVTLSSTSSTLKVGETQQLTAMVTPNIAVDKSVTWLSSDEKVATVDQNGLVKAVGVGAATITVKTNDGGFISTINITVISTNQDSNNNTGIGNTTNPQTGVAGIYGILTVAGFGLCSAFASRKRKNK